MCPQNVTTGSNGISIHIAHVNVDALPSLFPLLLLLLLLLPLAPAPDVVDGKDEDIQCFQKKKTRLREERKLQNDTRFNKSLISITSYNQINRLFFIYF